jgi:hypothetical protein
MEKYSTTTDSHPPYSAIKSFEKKKKKKKIITLRDKVVRFEHELRIEIMLSVLRLGQYSNDREVTESNQLLI